MFRIWKSRPKPAIVHDCYPAVRHDNLFDATVFETGTLPAPSPDTNLDELVPHFDRIAAILYGDVA